VTSTADTDATNELIDDGLIVQPLTSVEIEALKMSGAHASVCFLDLTAMILNSDSSLGNHKTPD